MSERTVEGTVNDGQDENGMEINEETGENAGEPARNENENGNERQRHCSQQ